MCGKLHGIEDCKDFLKLGIEERGKMIFKKKMLWVLPKSVNNA